MTSPQDAELVDVHMDEPSMADGSDTDMTETALHPRRHSSSISELAHSGMRLPNVVYFIIGMELCERFSYYGLRGILTLYLREDLHFSEAMAISIFSYSSALAYFMPMIGGFLSDTYLGKFRTIGYFGIVYAIGIGTLSLTSLWSLVWGMVLALALIGTGTGGIKPCVSAFGADQIPPSHHHSVSTYFHVFYFSINVGSVSSLAVTPIIRHYFGYPIAFSLPFFLLMIALVVFYMGRKQYVVTQPSGSLFSVVYNVITDARKAGSRGTTSSGMRGYSQQLNEIDADDVVTHSFAPAASRGRAGMEKWAWLDRATPIHGARVVSDVKALLKTMPVFAVLPLFWSLFDQQGSSWTLQANDMDRKIGLLTLQPEQLQVINPILILVLIPLFDRYIFPALRRRQIAHDPLRRMLAGMVIASMAFVSSGIVQSNMDDIATSTSVAPRSMCLPFNVSSHTSDCWHAVTCHISEQSLSANPDTSVSWSCISDTSVPGRVQRGFACSATANVARLMTGKHSCMHSKLGGHDKVMCAQLVSPCDVANPVTNTTVAYRYKHTRMKMNGVMQLNVSCAEVCAAAAATGARVGRVHVLWQLPQYVLIGIAEILISVTGLEFAYTEAPESMKSVIMALFLLTTAVGDLLTGSIFSIFSSLGRRNLFFLFAALMAVNAAVFSAVKKSYVYSAESSVTMEMVHLHDRRSDDGGADLLLADGNIDADESGDVR